MKQLASVATEILSYLDFYLDRLSDEQYAAPLPLLSDASIGEHTRHILDGFYCLLQQEETGQICYDQRERSMQVQRETGFARERLNMIRDRFRHRSDDRDVELKIAYGWETVAVASSMVREVIHNIEHTIHHLAIIKIALIAYHPDIEIPVSFGVAPSTLRYWEESGIKNSVQTGTASM